MNIQIMCGMASQRSLKERGSLSKGEQANRQNVFDGMQLSCYSSDDVSNQSSHAPAQILAHHRSREILQKELFLVSDRHSVATADLGFSDYCPIALRGSTQTLTIIGTLGCADLCSTNLPLDKRYLIPQSEFLRSRSRSQLRSCDPVH